MLPVSVAAAKFPAPFAADGGPRGHPLPRIFGIWLDALSFCRICPGFDPRWRGQSRRARGKRNARPSCCCFRVAPLQLQVPGTGFEPQFHEGRVHLAHYGVLLCAEPHSEGAYSRGCVEAWRSTRFNSPLVQQGWQLPSPRMPRNVHVCVLRACVLGGCHCRPAPCSVDLQCAGRDLALVR